MEGDVALSQQALCSRNILCWSWSNAKELCSRHIPQHHNQLEEMKQTSPCLPSWWSGTRFNGDRKVLVDEYLLKCCYHSAFLTINKNIRLRLFFLPQSWKPSSTFFHTFFTVRVTLTDVHWRVSFLNKGSNSLFNHLHLCNSGVANKHYKFHGMISERHCVAPRSLLPFWLAWLSLYLFFSTLRVFA